MIDRAAHGLAVGAGLDVEEILDVLWLSAAYPRSQADQVSKARPDGPAALTLAESPAQDAGEAPADPEKVPLYTDSQPENGADAAPATAVGFDAPRPLRRVTTLPMAVRRLRKVVAPGAQAVVDIEATVEATADACVGAKRWFVPVLTRPPQRALDLALVVDDARSMRIWDEVFDDLERLLAQTSAFRSVSRWRLSADDGTIRPHRRQRGGDGDDRVPAALIQRPEQLVDESGRRLVLVGTDARDPSWYNEAPWDAIATWCAAMPTVLVHMLPQQYWGDTAVGAPYMTSRALTPAAPNAQYKRRLAWWIADEDPGGPALPVVTLTEKSLDTWSQSIVNGTAWATGITATPPDPGSAPAADKPLDTEIAVHDFLTKATPGAQRLARILASTDSELSMPLISVLRERLAPETGVVELAEILASGLLEDVEPAGNGERHKLRYRTGAREILCRGTTVFEDWDAFAAVGRYLEDRHQVNGPFKVMVPDPAGTLEHSLNDKPFHDFHQAMAAHLGLRPGDPVEPQVPVPTVPVPVPEKWPAQAPDDDRAGSNDALRAALTTEVARLGDGDGDQFSVAVFGADGITIWLVTRDDNGTPQARRLTLTTGPVIDPQDFYASRLAPRLGDSRLLIAVGRPEESQAAVLGHLRGASGAPAFDCYEPFEDLLRHAIKSSPLTRWYDLIVLSETADGQLRLDSQPLFQPGATSGDQTDPLSIRCEPGDDHGTAFTVVARRFASEPFLPSQLHQVQARSAVVPPGPYEITALLTRPGRVRFDGLPTPLSDDSRPQAQLMRQVPKRLREPAPVHLACLIEVSGGQASLRHRIDRLEQLITDAAGTLRKLSVSVISYGPHAVERGVKEDPATVRARALSPERAIRALRGLASREVPPHEYERAAQTECALVELDNLLNGRDGKTMVVTAGGRPPHPRRVDLQSEIIPCRNKVDWRATIARLQRTQAIRFGALCDDDARGDIWRDLGRDAFARLNGGDIIPGFARDLGLLEGAQVVPFPVLEPAVWGAPGGPAPVRAEHSPVTSRTFAETPLSLSTISAGIVALGPPGSGKTAFLSALDIALKRQSYGLRLAGANDPSVELLIESTDRMWNQHEFPPATVGIGYFEWMLAGPASSGPRLTQGGTVEAAKTVRLSLGLADPSGEIVARTATSYADRQQLIQHVAGSEGILVMFDPIREFEHRDAFKTFDDFFRRVAGEVEASASGGLGKLPHHVAVCVTKFDDAAVLDAAMGLNLVTTDPHDPLGFPRVHDNDAREFFARLSRMHGRSDGERLLDLLDEVFHPARVRFFVTSSVGFYVDPRSGSFDPDDTQNVFTPTARAGPTRIRGGIRPINVVEPILWLADRIAVSAPSGPAALRRRGGALGHQFLEPDWQLAQQALAAGGRGHVLQDPGNGRRGRLAKYRDDAVFILVGHRRDQ